MLAEIVPGTCLLRRSTGTMCTVVSCTESDALDIVMTIIEDGCVKTVLSHPSLFYDHWYRIKSPHVRLV